MWKAIDKFGIFLKNIFTALKFAAFDYDVILRRTKNNKQRIIIWISIFIIIIGFVFGFMFILSYLIKTIINNRFIK
jgi:hypothetical protein